MHRITRDETHFSDAQLLAWDFVLPFKHIPIIPSDTEKAEEMAEFLEKAFLPEELSNAVKRLNL